MRSCLKPWREGREGRDAILSSALCVVLVTFREGDGSAVQRSSGMEEVAPVAKKWVRWLVWLEEGICGLLLWRIDGGVCLPL
jgi:hypothetical protein